MSHTDTEHRRLAAIMFTDMAGYSALTINADGSKPATGDWAGNGRLWDAKNGTRWDEMAAR